MKRTNPGNKSFLIQGCCFILTIILTSTVAFAREGVVVVAATQHFEAARAGIDEGDVLLSWSRGTESGVITSPFDVIKIELEESPLGTVAITGLHRSQERRWELGQEDWGIKTRPVFAPASLRLYLSGKRLSRTGEVSNIFSICNGLASADARQHWLYSWCAADAAELSIQQKQWRKADLLYRKALAQSTGESLVRIILLRNWALTFEERGSWDTVARLLRDSLATSKAHNPEGLITASILNDFAQVTGWRRDLNTANHLYQRALAINLKSAPRSLATARTLTSLAMVSINKGDQQAAQTTLDQVKDILQQLSPNGPDFAKYDGELASVLLLQGDLNQAEEHFEQMEKILEDARPDNLDLAGALSSLAFISARKGDLAGAELKLQRALRIYEKRPTNPVLGFNLSNDLGAIAYERRDFETAEKYGSKTESILEKLAPHSRDYAGCLINLGLYALSNDRVEAAERYWRQALTVIEAISPGSEEHAKTLGVLSEAEINLGHFDEAERYASSAMDILEKSTSEGIDRADVMSELAEIDRHRGELRQAEEYIRHALSIDRKFIPGSPDYAERTATLAAILRAEGQPEAAANEYERAIATLEADMVRLGGSTTARSTFRASHSSIYKDYIDLLVQQGKSDRAFQMAESSHASTLLEILNNANVKLRQNVDPSSRLQEQKLRDEFSVESDRRIRLLMGVHSDEELRSSNETLQTIVDKLDDIESKIQAGNTPYGYLIHPDPITIDHVQHQLLDSDTMLLEYSLGDQNSYLWVITSDSASCYRLPARAQIDAAVRNAYKSLADSREYRDRNQTRGSTVPLDTLSRMVLAPIQGQLGRKRVLLVTDGSLNYIPFSALTIHNAPSGKPAALVDRHEIVSLPSASVLMAARREHAGRQQPPRAVAVVADPVFDEDDPRIKKVEADRSHLGAPATNNGQSSFATEELNELTKKRWVRTFHPSGSNKIYLPRLLYSRLEAHEILSVTPSHESREALDFKASRAEAMDPTLAQYKIVHFATHGLVDTIHPEFSGLILSLYNEKGEPENGLLSLEDIYNLNLPVDMVVLSACDTALGKDAKGEGLVGLTRGFMYAGASRVVASLWAVNDAATATLMAHFYRAIEQDHLSAAAALRKAQLEMLNSTRWSNPYYWAGFELQGEWR